MADDKEVKPDSPSMVQLASFAQNGEASQILLVLSERFSLDFFNAARRKLDHQPASIAQLQQQMTSGNGSFAMGQVVGHLTDSFLAAAQRTAARIYTPPEATAETGAKTTVAPKAPGSTK